MQDADPDNKASFTHELIAGAASYEAAKAYENHCDANGLLISPYLSFSTITVCTNVMYSDIFDAGDPGSHQEAKEIAAGFSGAFVDRECETRGLDFIDREKAKRMAEDQNNQAIDQSGQFGN